MVYNSKMPVERDAEKRSGQGTPGKKRKKKKEEKCATGGAKFVKGGEKEAEVLSKGNNSAVLLRSRSAAAKRGIDAGSGLVMVGSRALLRQNDRSSSNSSIEYSKPTMKVGRFDYSSSDAMSIGGRTSANSSGAMDVVNGTDPTHTPTSAAHITTAKSTSHKEDCEPVLEGSDLAMTRSTGAARSDSHERDCKPISEGSNSAIDIAHITTAKSEPDTPVHVESLRWDHHCSDEEEEKQRIEIYKENRRKRYEKALQERKARLSLCTTSKVKYYVI